MTELQPLGPQKPMSLSEKLVPRTMSKQKGTIPPDLHSPAAITFVRSRMYYARAALNAKGRVTFGMRHIRESEDTAFSPQPNTS